MAMSAPAPTASDEPATAPRGGDALPGLRFGQAQRVVSCPARATTSLKPTESSQGPAVLEIGALLERPQRLPEFYLVSLRIVDPCETAVVVVFAFWIDPDTFGRELREESVEIGDAKVDHEGRRARVEVLRAGRERRPYRHSCVCLRIVGPPERRALARLVGYAQMPCVPLRKSLGIARLEKDSSNTRHTLAFGHHKHLSTYCTSPPERAHTLLDLQRLLHRVRPLARIVGDDGRRRIDDGRAERAGEQADQVLERMDPLLLVQLAAGDAYVSERVLLQMAGGLRQLLIPPPDVVEQGAVRALRIAHLEHLHQAVVRRGLRRAGHRDPPGALRCPLQRSTPARA